MIYKSRQQKAVTLLSELGVDAIVFCQLENIRYLCGFTGTDGVLVISDRHICFLTDSRYTTQAEQQVAADCIKEYKVKTDGVLDCLTHESAHRVAFESSLSYGLATELQAASEGQVTWSAFKRELDALRLIKDDCEITALQHAADLNYQVFNEVNSQLRPGITEREFALELEFGLKRLGAEEKAFDFIVASGPRGALPHGIASDRKIGIGELVTIDFGCRRNGYHSDETITVAVGEVSAELRKLFDIVLEAHDRAMDAVTPGAKLVDIDRVARQIIEAAGYADNFGHGLGHGVGLNVHEAPVVSPRSKELIAEVGMVFSIEPGIYIPNLGGVRIEDTIHVTENGAVALTKIPKQFCNILVD